MTVRQRDGIHFERASGESGVVADTLATEYGYRARPPKRHQTTLEEF